jgi:hypothetical protein
MNLTSPYRPENRLNFIVGNFGSGKTEVAVNLALQLAEAHPVQIVDLDIVNPYFRCREARAEMESAGIRVVYPQGEFHSADLPIILPEVKGALSSTEGYVIFDVGGDDMGARVLSSLADALEDGDYAMLQVINTRRPFTGTVEGCIRIKEEIEAASRLRITGIIANTHLMDETEPSTILEGVVMARKVADDAGLTLEFATVNTELYAAVEKAGTPCPLLAIDRRMLPPWRLRSMTDRAGRILKKENES